MCVLEPAARGGGLALVLIVALLAGAGCVGSSGAQRVEEAQASDRPTPDAGNRAEPGGALPDLEGEPTLSDYLKYAELTNPGLRAAYDQWLAALEQVPQAKSLPDPQIEAVEALAGPQQWSLMLAQGFPWFGTLSLRGKMAVHGASAARAEYESARLMLAYEITIGYCEYYYLARAVAVTQENVELLGELESVAREEYAAGTAPHAAVVRAQVELARLNDRLRTLEEGGRPAVARLNAALNRPADAPLPWPTGIPEGDALPVRERLRELLVEGNPELKALEFAAAKAQAALALARKQRYPDIMLGVTYMSSDETMTGSGDSGENPVMAMVSVNLPIWGRKYGAAEREARFGLDAALRQREEKANALVSRLEMAAYGVEDAERKIKLYSETLIPQAQQAMKVTQQAFTAGDASFLDLIDSQRTLLDVQLEHERALVDRAEGLAEVEMLVGRKLIPADGQPQNGAGGNPGGPEAVVQ
jgi:outer membrane protein TolC